MILTQARPLLAAVAPDLTTHAHSHGPIPWQHVPRLIATVRAAGLTGRGGAGFPVWRKLTAAGQGDRPVVVANGAEGEPASHKDAYLLANAPHLVLDGLQLAADAVGACDAYLYAPEASLRPIRTALSARAALGWDRLPVRLVEAPARFIAGQESAVVAAIEGKPALPRDTPPRVTEAGVHGAPTLVQNVETLSQLALLARYGTDWFRQHGTAEEPGTFLATVTGAVATPGVFETGYGSLLGELLDLAGGPTSPLSAVLVGGYHGTWIPADPSLRISRTGLADYGGSPGAGVIIALPTGACGLAYTARIAGYLATQSARQCGPCHIGLPRIAETLTLLASSPTPAVSTPHRITRWRTDSTAPPRSGIDEWQPAAHERQRQGGAGLVGEVARLSALVAGRGACHHPDGTARMAASAMRVFAGEVQAHLRGRCSAQPGAFA